MPSRRRLANFAVLAALTSLTAACSPEDIARAVVFLTDDAAGYITGANLPVNGGLFMSF